ncbi:OmpA family protein [Ginsengibacter hankyongi]|uniref:OmpA family protein n=1 Tax=Ginsengibacter hankyongi TaxID=2607284 RepID=A0A5J5IB68_9BACT|nr:OmpA family protein [Ginsengibacter hankyongi]KAA9035520.1 OmpA family protein [Ginsengibacter hankyongi]
MKAIILLITICAFLNIAQAQKVSDVVKQQAGEGVKEGASIATQQTANKVTDRVLDKLFSKKKKKNDAKDNTNNTNNNITQSAPAQSSAGNNTQEINTPDTPTSLTTYSKFDFVPGDKVLVYEDFSRDAIGDFPENWNTNSAGETVTASSETGHWLMINKKGVFKPEGINKLPDNFTLEFNLIYSSDNYIPTLQTLFLSAGNGKDGNQELNADFSYNKRSGINLGIQPIPRDKGGIANIYAFKAGDKIMDNQIEFQNNGATKIKVSIWRQKQRLRVYLDQNKVFDLPRAFSPGETYNNVMFQTWSDFPNQDKYLISNIKLAVGEPDTRNKLINEGKFSTTGILFDVNSAAIKPESYGSLKDIASVLQDNSGIHVKIIGHTDNDGDAAMNLALSKKRAAALKAALISDFSIDGSRLETDGKGSSDPVATNSTPEGKAQNRRVEFIKL